MNVDLECTDPSLEEHALADLKALYFQDRRPWVVAFSGGKDSTVVLQLVYTLLLDLGSRAGKPVFVIASDTGVEAPNVSAYLESTLTAIRTGARRAGFIQSGEDRFEPLMRFRDELKAIREDNTQRMPHRKNGSPEPGPFRPEVRQRLLRDLLILEQKVGEELISDNEIAYIQAQWSADFDLKDSALEIASAYGRKVAPMPNIKLPPVEQQVLDELLVGRNLDPDLIDKLLSLVLSEHPDLRVWGSKAALQRDIERVINASVTNTQAAEDAP